MSHQSRMQDVQEARAAAKADPQNPMLWSNLGFYLMEAGMNRAALTEFGKARRLDPKDPVFLNNMGDCLIALGEHHEAIETLNQAIALNPEFARPYYHRARAHQALGDLDAAKADLNRALAKEQDKRHRLQCWLMLEEIDPSEAGPEEPDPQP